MRLIFIFRFLYTIFIKKGFFVNLFFLKNVLNILFQRNLSTYSNLLFFYKFKFNLKLVYPHKFKYSWINTKNDLNKFYFNFIESYYFVEFFQIYSSAKFNKHFFIKEIINFKNKTGFFKKTNSIKNIYISKINFGKFNFLEKNLINIKGRANENLIFKNFEFVEKKLNIYKNNRNIFKTYFNLQKKKKFFINKFIKKFLKIDFMSFANFFEFSLINILLNSNFFLNRKDVFFFLKSGYVYKNGKVICNMYQVLNEGDIISLLFNKYYYFLYREYVNKINLNFSKFNIFKKLNKFKITDIDKDFNFINKIVFFKNDIPKFIEIDYLSMSLILLYKNINSTNYNYFNLKLINIFLKRLYNWKYII